MEKEGKEISGLHEEIKNYLQMILCGKMPFVLSREDVIEEKRGELSKDWRKK